MSNWLYEKRRCVSGCFLGVSFTNGKIAMHLGICSPLLVDQELSSGGTPFILDNGYSNGAIILRRPFWEAYEMRTVYTLSGNWPGQIACSGCLYNLIPLF